MFNNLVLLTKENKKTDCNIEFLVHIKNLKTAIKLLIFLILL